MFGLTQLGIVHTAISLAAIAVLAVTAQLLRIREFGEGLTLITRALAGRHRRGPP